MIEFKWIEWLGYLASIIVAVSLTMANIRRLRWINLLGASAFTLYGWILNLYPVFFVNLFITFINIYYLIRMSLTKDRFHLIPISWKTRLVPSFVWVNQIASSIARTVSVILSRLTPALAAS